MYIFYTKRFLSNGQHYDESSALDIAF